MSILQYARKSLLNALGATDNKLFEAVYKWRLSEGMAVTMSDDPTAYITEGYSGNSDVYSIINRIVRMAGQGRLCLYNKDANGKWAEVTNHELTAFTKRANPNTRMSDFIQSHLIYKLAIGNVYWYKPTLTSGINTGKTKELWMLPSNDMKIVGGKHWMEPVGGYRFSDDATVRFEPFEVHHSKYFNPLFGTDTSLYGQSPLKAAARTVSKQNEAEATEQKQFQNQGPARLIYKDSPTQTLMNSGLTTEQRGEIKKLLKESSGAINSGKVGILPEKFGLLDLGISPVDLNILESSKEGRRILCSIYGMPSELFNDKQGSTYNNMIEAKKDAWNNCIKPNLKEFASDLTAFLIDPVAEYASKGLFFEWDYSEVAELQADYAVMVGWMKAARYTPNEIREATGQKPIDVPQMNEPWFAMGESPLSELTAPLPELDLTGQKDYK